MNEPPNERNDWPLLDLLRRFEVTPKNNQRAVAGVPTHPEENDPAWIGRSSKVDVCLLSKNVFAVSVQIHEQIIR